MDNNKLPLYEFILDYYSLSELKDLCFYLDVVYDDLDGAARKDKARELVEHLARRRRLDDLRAVLSQQRPEQYGEKFPALDIAPPKARLERPLTSAIVDSRLPTVVRLDDSSPTPLPPRYPALPNRRIHAKTGIELIRIPAGPFLYGSADSDEMACDDEKPQRAVNLPEYWIGRTPVTNAQFARFVKATGYRTQAERDGYSWGWTGKERDQRIRRADWRHLHGPETSINGKGDHPVVQVSWYDIRAFCEWGGLALPTEEQWEKAARGTDGRIWPWGNEPPTVEHCNFNNNVGDTTPIGQYSSKGDSPYGCVDMAGNVWEWVQSWYPEDSRQAWRGGASNEDAQYTRAAYRYINQLHYRHDDVGFRVAELLSDPAP
jgi:formylglycine-generating enzyme required for sulfatase activity